MSWTPKAFVGAALRRCDRRPTGTTFPICTSPARPSPDTAPPLRKTFRHRPIAPCGSLAPCTMPAQTRASCLPPCSRSSRQRGTRRASALARSSSHGHRLCLCVLCCDGGCTALSISREKAARWRLRRLVARRPLPMLGAPTAQPPSHPYIESTTAIRQQMQFSRLTSYG
jgi:hypothetical protein